jgi:hypothetical protein
VNSAQRSAIGDLEEACAGILKDAVEQELWHSATGRTTFAPRVGHNAIPVFRPRSSLLFTWPIHDKNARLPVVLRAGDTNETDMNI